MRKLIGMVFGFGLGMVAMWLAMNFHFVKTESDWFVVGKQDVRFADAYVDVAKWDAAEWDRHPKLQESLVKAGRGGLIPEYETEEFLRDTIRRLGSAAEDLATQRQ